MKYILMCGGNYNELIFGKMNADYYVDDKNMSIEEFINFKE